MASAPLGLDREAHVWLVRDPLSDEAYARAWAILDDAERERALAFAFDRDRTLYVAAHALVRTTLSRYAPTAPAAWTFSVGAHGRPEIAPPGRLRFNLSHTRGVAACAVTLDYDLGVDVEAAKTHLDLDALARHSFSPGEYAALQGLPRAEKRARFFRYWTLKEAYIKARGLGLALPTTRFGFTLAPRLAIAFDAEIADEPADWQFFAGDATSEVPLALAIRRGGGEDLVIVQRWLEL